VRGFLRVGRVKRKTIEDIKKNKVKRIKPFIEIVLIVNAFIESFWLGIFVLAYVIYAKSEYEKIKNRLEMCLFRLRIVREELSMAERDEKDLIEKLDEYTPERIHLYKGCVIEEYQSNFRLMESSGKKIDKVFFSLDKAEKMANLIGNTENENTFENTFNL